MGTDEFMEQYKKDTMPAVLLDLARKCEEAEGPDRELDGLIYGAIKSLRRNENATFILDIDGERFQFQHPTDMMPSGHPAALYIRGYSVPEYSASLDAAVSLMPDGWWTQHVGQVVNPEGWRARSENPGRSFEARAATEPLARTAVALRARASSVGQD